MDKTLRQALLESKLPGKETLAGLIRECLRLDRDPHAPDLATTGVSRFGGAPDLPPGLDWPAWNGVPLSFVAQINLAELPGFPERGLLPETGLLSFFYAAGGEPDGTDLSEAGCSAVRYTPAPEECRPRPFPEDFPGDSVYIPARISYTVIESHPLYDEMMMEDYDLAALDDFEEYDDLKEKYIYIQTEEHQVLGYATHIQWPPGLDCEQVRQAALDPGHGGDSDLWRRARPGYREWELLLQVRSDIDLNMYWPADMGILYFMIRREDLLARRFDKAWMVKQYS